MERKIDRDGVRGRENEQKKQKRQFNCLSRAN